MTFMFFSFVLISIISMIIMKLSLIVSMKFKMNFEKMSPFECGFNPMFFKRMPFSIRFFLITIIFLIFDIEIALLMPMIISYKISNILIWFITSIMIIIVLIIGLFHEWNHGALNWL